MEGRARVAAEHYAAQVDAVIEQRTRFRGEEPPGDLFDALPPDHNIMRTEPRRALEPNLAVIASYIEPDDVIIDVGGGAGRSSLPLALRCREVVNVDPSSGMGRGFLANAARADVTNVRFVAGDWLAVEPPLGTVVLVNHVTYLTREIVPFIQKLEQAGTRRVIITVNSPPPTNFHHKLYELVYGEAEAPTPGHESLMEVLWELGIEPDLIMLPQPSNRIGASASRESAISAAIASFRNAQWALWPFQPDLEGRIRDLLESGFDRLFRTDSDGIHAT